MCTVTIFTCCHDAAVVLWWCRGRVHMDESSLCCRQDKMIKTLIYCHTHTLPIHGAGEAPSDFLVLMCVSVVTHTPVTMDYVMSYEFSLPETVICTPTV